MKIVHAILCFIGWHKIAEPPAHLPGYLRRRSRCEHCGVKVWENREGEWEIDED